MKNSTKNHYLRILCWEVSVYIEKLVKFIENKNHYDDINLDILNQCVAELQRVIKEDKKGA